MDESQQLPQHIAVIMDGNGRWAKKRFLPRFAGHRAGVEAVRRTVTACAEKGIQALTLFAFGNDNLQRPREEVGYLVELLFTSMQREVAKLHDNNIRMRFIGNYAYFGDKLTQKIHEAEAMTANNTGMTLVIAVNYSGRWDITQATQKIAQQVADGHLQAAAIDEQSISTHLSCADLPDPDLFIRTSGELRISNFLLWQLSYTELFFADVYWPDFGVDELEQALTSFQSRQRRFGRTGEQVRVRQSQRQSEQNEIA